MSSISCFFFIFFLLLLASSNWAAVLPKPENPNAVPFRAGFMLAQSANVEENAEQQLGQQAAEFGGDCQQPLVERIRAQLAENELLSFEGNLLSQFLALTGRRERICRIFTAESRALNECIGHSPGPRGGALPLSPLVLILQTMCVQFAEALDAHGQCLAELQLKRLEAQCAEACQRHAETLAKQQVSAGNSSTSSSGSEPLCQLAVCAVNCFGAQISECAEEVDEGAPKGNPAELKAMADQLAGLQMLAGLQQPNGPVMAQAQLLQGQVPSECAQLMGKAVSSANFVAEHDPVPADQDQQFGL